MAVPCSAIAKSGQQCSRPALAGKRHCLMHDPASVELRRDAGRKGGYARSNAARARKAIPEAMTAEEMAGWLSLVFTRVLTGQTSPKIGAACAQLARTMLVVQETALLEERLAELEERAGIRRAS